MCKKKAVDPNAPPKKPGVVGKMKAMKKKIERSIFWHVYQAFNKYLAFIAMIAAFLSLIDPPPFTIGHEIWEATAQPFITPAKSQLFNLIEAANVKPEMKNTKYMMAYKNGKSSVRVCTDLSRNIFEGLVGIDKKYRAWDEDLNFQNFNVDDYEANCFNFSNANVSDTGSKVSYIEPRVVKLALNSGCQSTNNVSQDNGELQWSSMRGDAGTCGQPGVNENAFASPDPGHGFLWHYMFKHEAPTWFERETNSTNRTCSTSTCNTAKCKTGDCYDPAATCKRYVQTASCAAFYNHTNPSLTSIKTCSTEIKPDYNKYGYCDCGLSRKIYMCNVVFDFKCEDVCKCNSGSGYLADTTTTVAPTTTTATAAPSKCGALEQCSCNETLKVNRLEPQWIQDRIHMKDLKTCGAILGKFNDKACDQKYVHSYRIDNLTIVALFGTAIGIRIVYQFLCMYWGCTEDNEDYRILFSNESFLILYSICKFSLKRANDAIEKENLQGWPWLLGFLDSGFTFLATILICWGADPRPEMRMQRFGLLLLWIAAIQELQRLLTRIYNTFALKLYYVTGESRNVACGKTNIPWCLQREEQPKESYKVEVQPTTTSDYTGENKEA